MRQPDPWAWLRSESSHYQLHCQHEARGCAPPTSWRRAIRAEQQRAKGDEIAGRVRKAARAAKRSLGWRGHQAADGREQPYIFLRYCPPTSKFAGAQSRGQRTLTQRHRFTARNPYLARLRRPPRRPMTPMANSARTDGSGMTAGPVSWKSCRFPTGGTWSTHGSAGLPRS